MLPVTNAMCKAVDRGMVMADIRLLEKHGGKSGSFINSTTDSHGNH